MKARIFFLLVGVLGANAFGQVEIWPEDSLKEYEGQIVTVYTKDYLNTYNRMKRLVIKVYPYALHAADIIDEIDENAENISKRRKQNKFYKESYQQLRDDFKYFILDLYTSEGRMLMKLIHRETGMTVYDISSKYRGKQKAEMFNLMAKIWDQDLHIKFDPTTGDDKITEQVIQDIQSGLIPFNDEIVTVDRLEYRDKKAAEKAGAKRNKKRNKEYVKAQKEKKRQEKRQVRKNK